MKAPKVRRYTEKNDVKRYSKKHNSAIKRISAIAVFALVATALSVPTNALAPNVDAVENRKAVSYSIIEEITETEATTQPQTEEITETTAETTEEETSKAVEETTEETQPLTEPVTQKETEPVEETTQKPTIQVVEDAANNSYQGNYLVSIGNIDPSYSPKQVSLSKYDRDKLERLVMGEAGTMGYTGCALVAQAIRDAMNRSNTTSIDYIISEYKYIGTTLVEPSQTVKDAVSFIFDQNGSAVGHRILVFYTGKSQWHETQKFIISYGNVRFFDIWD